MPVGDALLGGVSQSGAVQPRHVVGHAEHPHHVVAGVGELQAQLEFSGGGAQVAPEPVPGQRHEPSAGADDRGEAVQGLGRVIAATSSVNGVLPKISRTPRSTTRASGRSLNGQLIQIEVDALDPAELHRLFDTAGLRYLTFARSSGSMLARAVAMTSLNSSITTGIVTSRYESGDNGGQSDTNRHAGIAKVK
ncbi:hypothetical protein [Microtetraspora malaysiensis]|uniref:hypothetical protein n=1 Tax=Microtetraspora malaysiensis TaxID=161358 RepID=UPI003D8A93A9